MSTKTALLWPGDPIECGSCDGEGYRYYAVEGRHVEHPVAEVRCRRCLGTGLEVTP